VAKKQPKSPDREKPGFEQSLDTLETIVHQLEDGELGLAESLARYEEGVKLLRQCYELLEKAERRIELLSGVDADGNPVSTPLDDTSPSLDEKARRRSRRRSAAETSDPPESGGSRAGETDVDRPGELF